MCGRYFLEDSSELRPIVEEMNRSPLLPLFLKSPGAVVCSGEAAPSHVVPVIALSRSGKRAVFPMKWGYTVPKPGGGSRLLINARAETAADKPTFRESWRAHRCLIPASWYFEWEHLTAADGKKTIGPKYSIRPEAESVSWLCGLYRMEEGLPVFVILTREAGNGTRFIHDRMPLMLPRERADEWIRPDADPDKLANEALTAMFYERNN